MENNMEKFKISILMGIYNCEQLKVKQLNLY